MSIPRRLETVLKERRTDYRPIVHPEAYTAQEIAAALHVKGRELAKSVLLKTDGKFVMAVLPAAFKVDFEKLKDVLHGGDIRLASEDEFVKLFPDCEKGAEPPFGSLYGVDTIVESSLADDEDIYFNAGTHYEAIEMKYRDFADIENPTVADFAQRH